MIIKNQCGQIYVQEISPEFSDILHIFNMVNLAYFAQ